MRTRKPLPEPRGVLALYDDVLTRQGSGLTTTQELDFTHALLPLLCGIQNATPTMVSGTNDYEWEFSPRHNNPRPVRTATVEVAETDGVTNHYAARFPYGVCTEFTVNIPEGEETATIDSTWIGRAEDVRAPTASLGHIAASRSHRLGAVRLLAGHHLGWARHDVASAATSAADRSL